MDGDGSWTGVDAADLLPARYAEYYLGSMPSLTWLLVVNGVAFLAGIRFYVETMPAVPTLLWPLYGDSPAALALAALSLSTLLPALGGSVREAPVNRALAYLHTLAVAWLVKFGLWTLVALNRYPELYVGFDAAALWSYWGLLLTHALFVVEAALIAHYGATTRGALAMALGLLLCNDYFDYGLGNHPPLRYEPGVALPAATVLLSVVAVAVAGALLPRLSALPAERRRSG